MGVEDKRIKLIRINESFDTYQRINPYTGVIDTHDSYARLIHMGHGQMRTLITTNETLSGLTERVADPVYDSHSGLVKVATITGPSFRTGR